MLQHSALGQTARFERFAAEMLFYMASGRRIDPDRAERFSVQVDAIYANPFVPVKKQPQTAEEIKQYISGRIDELLHGGVNHGSDDACREDHA